MTAAIIAAAIASAAGLMLAWIRCCFVMVTVHGSSMEPLLQHGDRILVQRPRNRAIYPGQVVVIERPPTRDLVVKRVVAVGGDPVPEELALFAPHLVPLVPLGHFAVLGDNRARSTDSRHFGFVPVEAVLGVVSRSAGQLANKVGNSEESG